VSSTKVGRNKKGSKVRSLRKGGVQESNSSGRKKRGGAGGWESFDVVGSMRVEARGATPTGKSADMLEGGGAFSTNSGGECGRGMGGRAGVLGKTRGGAVFSTWDDV